MRANRRALLGGILFGISSLPFNPLRLLSESANERKLSWPRHEYWEECRFTFSKSDLDCGAYGDYESQHMKECIKALAHEIDERIMGIIRENYS